MTVAPPGWDAAAARSPRGHAMQSSTWARIREWQGWRPEFVRIGEPLPVALVLWRDALPGRPIAYVPRGPIVASGDTAGLRTGLDRLASLARERNAIFMKVDPELASAEAESALREVGYRRAADIQPVVATLQLDLHADEDTLFGALEKDTRWSVRQATKRGVRIVGAIAIDDGLPRDFYDLYATTGRRAGFITRAWSYYEETWGELIADGLAELLVAYVGDEAVAGAMVWRCGDRALYQTAATNEAGRKSHAAYALLWQCIIEAKRAGRTVFDMGGIPQDLDRKDDPMYGPYLFKRGFGGKEVRWVGAHDTVPRPFAYRAYLMAEPAYTAALRLVGRMRG